MYKVYALVDSRYPDQFRYIGITKRKLNQRLSGHLCYKNNPYRTNWIKKVQREGGNVNIVLLEECADVEKSERERFLIADYRSKGHRLTNLTAGGDGCYDPPQEVRDKISRAKKGVPKSLEMRKRMSEACKGRYAGVKNPNYGKKHTEAIREKISKALTGKKLSPEHIEKVRKSLLGVHAGTNNGQHKLTEEQVIEIYRLKIVEKVSVDTIGKKFGIHPMSVYKITNGHKWAHLKLKERFAQP